MVTLVKRSKKKEKHKKKQDVQTLLLNRIKTMEMKQLDSKVNLLTNIILTLAWKLRNDEGYGKKRTTQFITELFDTYSDVNVGGLLTFEDINNQLKKEIKLDVLTLLVEQADKHKTRCEVLYKGDKEVC